jgi:Dolichyl-phosphate-mannose-protein mannosyltransferase
LRETSIDQGPRVRAAIRLQVLFIAGLMVASASLLYSGLGNPYITLWDESVHVNVVRNLTADCCVPRLHPQPYGTDPQDWTNNYVWLHKPPLPFYFNAAIASIGSGSLVAIRVAALLAAECLIALVFFTGLRFFDTSTAVVAATLVAFNHYTFQLVQGRQFSGIVDLTLACAVTGALYFLLAIAEKPRLSRHIVFGALSGLAFLCKDGLGLIPFAVLVFAGLSGVLPWRRHVFGVAAAALAALIVAAPLWIYLAVRFPTETLLEQQLRPAHIWRDVEGWARPLDYYLTVYAGRVTSPLIVGTAGLAVTYGVRSLRRNPLLGLLALWTITYVGLLSLAVSKISNFIYPVVPAVYLLLPAAVMRLRREGRHDLIAAGAAAVLATAVFLHWDLLNSSSWVVDFPPVPLRPALIAFQSGVFAIALIVLRWVRPRDTAHASITAVSLALLVILVSSVNASRAASTAQQRDHAEQMQLRDAAMRLRATLHPDDVVLVDWPGIRKSHLYVMFWSGAESFELTPMRPLADRLTTLLPGARAYLLTRSAEPSYAGEPWWSGPGYLYRIHNDAQMWPPAPASELPGRH